MNNWRKLTERNIELSYPINLINKLIWYLNCSFNIHLDILS